MIRRILVRTIVSILSLTIGWVFFLPVRRLRPVRDHDPIDTFCRAVEAVNAMRQEDASCAQDLCQTLFLHHGTAQPRVVLFFHGYTNCPQQFRVLGERLHELGCNVLAPRMPRHGLNDRLTEEHALLTASELSSWGNAMIDCARGLGASVTIAGLSAGGTLAAWCALQRHDIERAVIMSPVFGYHGFPLIAMEPLMRIMLRLPNFFKWWEPGHRDNTLGPRYVYPRYATRTLGELLRMASSVRHTLERGQVTDTPVTFVTNPCDRAIHGGAIDRVERLWRSRGKSVTRHVLPAELQLPHDFIDPADQRQKIDDVYPAIINLLIAPQS